MTDTLTSRQAAERLAVSVPYFHRLMELEGIAPAMSVPRPGGDKLWATVEIDRLATNRETARRAKAAAKP